MTTTIKTPARTLTLADAGRKLCAWRSCRHKELYGVESKETDAIPELLQAIEGGVVTSTRDAHSGDVVVDASSFYAWRLRQSTSLSDVKPLPVRALDKDARDIHPATATAWIAFGDAWAPERVAAFLNRAHLLHLMLGDVKCGAITLDADTLGMALKMEAGDATFARARDELETALKTLGIGACAADDGRILHAGDFANSIWLDVVAGKYVASPAAMMFTADWERAVTAAHRIGAVRLSGSDLIRKFGRRRSNGLKRARAADALRGQFEAWRRGDGPLPKRVEWERRLGAELAGTKHGAGVVWKEVTKDPAYAAARKPGVRPATKKNTPS
jgi:hypothetical protein